MVGFQFFTNLVIDRSDGLKAKFGVFFAFATACTCSYAIDGHNGIRFEMTQQQLEAKGFICNPNAKQERSIVATCRHMDLTGVAFNIPTSNYQVEIDADNQVASIRADLIGIRSASDYLGLLTHISEFFPRKDEAGSFRGGGTTMKDAWRANNNAGISIFYSAGARGIIKDTLWVTFNSPSYMSALDKRQTSARASHGVEVKENTAREGLGGQPNASGVALVSSAMNPETSARILQFNQAVLKQCPKFAEQLSTLPGMKPVLEKRPVDSQVVCACAGKLVSADARLQEQFKADDSVLRDLMRTGGFVSYMSVRLLSSVFVCLAPELDAALAHSAP